MASSENRSSRRLASSQALLRSINEQIRIMNASQAEGASEYLCECGRGDCEPSISMPLETYAAIRADPLRFIALAGHENPETERVVEDHGDWVVVEPR